MKEIKLLELELQNFKGIRELKLKPGGQDLNIYGQNKTGKTTIMDAFLWLLFGKDSRGQAQFDIKTKDDDGNVLHGLNHSVKGTLEIGGSQLTLERIYREKWQKKKGSANKRFTGHTTDYKISGSPVKKKEYERKINDIIDEEVFRLLTNPRYFCEQLHWEERREILIEACGNVEQDEVMNAGDGLKKLKKVLDNRTIEQHKKKVRGEMKEINEELENIPVRIDEANNNLPEISGYDDWKEIQARIESLKSKKKQKEKELSKAESGNGVAEKQKRLAEIETEIQELKNKHSADIQDELQEKRKKFNEICNKIDEVSQKIKRAKNCIKYNQKDIQSNKNEQDELREEWNELQEEKEKLLEENWTGELECPTCGQELPEEQIEEKKEQYNQDKAERIEEIGQEQDAINEQGVSLSEEIDKLNKEIEQLEQDIEELEKEKSELKEKSSGLEEEMKSLENQASTYKETMKYKKLQSEKDKIQESIEKLKSGNQEELKLIDSEISEIEEKIENEQDKLQDIKSHRKGQKRIEELKEREEELAEKYEELEHQLHLTEEYTRTKVVLLEDKINSQFEHTEFKLFEEQINGGIKETCVALDAEDGAEFGNTLNTGSEYKIGVDIINTLSEHYGYRAPVFLDNCESVTETIETESQLIKLIVSEDHNQLKIEEAN